MVHVSRKPVLVPVFTAAGKGTSKGVTPPNPGMRASGSLRMSLMTYACSALSTRRGAAGARSKRIRPDPVERAIEVLGRVRPLVGREGGGYVEQWRRRGVAALEGRGIEERFERRAGLPRRPHHVDLAAVERVSVGGAPDPREDAPCP